MTALSKRAGSRSCGNTIGKGGRLRGLGQLDGRRCGCGPKLPHRPWASAPAALAPAPAWHRQAQRAGDQQQRQQRLQAVPHAPERDLDVPAFDLGAPVQTAEAGTHVERLDQAWSPARPLRLPATRTHGGGSTVSRAHIARADSDMNSTGTNTITSAYAPNSSAASKPMQTRSRGRRCPAPNRQSPADGVPDWRRLPAGRPAGTARGSAPAAARSGRPASPAIPRLLRRQRFTHAGASENRARDSTNSGMRSNTGFNHHIATATHGRSPVNQPITVNKANTGSVTSSHGNQIARAWVRTRRCPASIASHGERGRNSTRGWSRRTPVPPAEPQPREHQRPQHAADRIRSRPGSSRSTTRTPR